MRTPQLDMKIFRERRDKLRDKLKNAALVIPAHPELIRNNDVHYPYRQDSNLFYLTGFEESHSVLVFRPGQTPELTLFVQPKDEHLETWTGFRYGLQATKELFQVDATEPISKLEEQLATLLKPVDKVYYSLYTNREFDSLLLKTVEQITQTRSRSNKGNITIEDTRVLMGELRLRKSTFEADQMRTACQISARAHIEVMKATRPGVNERALHGVFIKSIMEQGCAREGYGSIVASGANATTLHYVYNDQPCRDGEVLLVDAGGEYNFYSADITRSFPVSGKFSVAHKRVYQKVLDLQKNLVAMVRPGVTRELLQKEAISVLTDIMIDEKLLKGRKEDLLEKKEYMKFYMHGVGHWLGLDVHDAGTIEMNGEPRPLEPGFVVTIEPGLYIPKDAPGVPDELRGLGIRIEDDILVTASGNENLTVTCPKEVADMEAIIGRG
jgi:Xaa-Pro aminopeptidase